MKSYFEKTLFTSKLSVLIGFAFMAYNGALGMLYGAVWNISISIYYAILLALRLYVLRSAGRYEDHPDDLQVKKQKRQATATYCILFFMDFALIAPIMDMAFGHRSYSFGLIPAIAAAVYTTYRVISSVLHYRKSGKTNNIFILELRTLNLVDTLVAVLSLQNTLIIANGGFSSGMRTLTFSTSVGILLIIFIITASSYSVSKRKEKNR